MTITKRYEISVEIAGCRDTFKTAVKENWGKITLTNEVDNVISISGTKQHLIEFLTTHHFMGNSEESSQYVETNMVEVQTSLRFIVEIIDKNCEKIGYLSKDGNLTYITDEAKVFNTERDFREFQNDSYLQGESDLTEYWNEETLDYEYQYRFVPVVVSKRG